MSQVVSFVDYTPARRFDGTPWTSATIEEGPAAYGPWSLIDTLALIPVDSDPTQPMSRNLTTAQASDQAGLWYRVVWTDAAGARSPTLPVQNVAPEVLSPLALCTDEDVRQYLGIKPGELSEEDRNTVIRLVNAASNTFADESQRIWKLDPSLDPRRRYRIEEFDLTVGRLRIDDCTAINAVGYGDFRDPLGPAPLVDTSWYPWKEEPDQPIIGIVFTQNIPVAAGNVIEVDADWGWPAVPEKVRQAVIYTAAEWYARDVEKFSATFSIDQGRILLPQVLPGQVQRMAEDYRRWRVT